MRPVPEYDPKSWLMKALRETPHAIESLLWEMDERDVARPGADDEWSCAQIVCHLADMEERYTDRLERIVRLREPHLAAFDADSIQAEAEPRDEDAFERLDEFASQRRQSVYLLWSLDDDDWERRGIHPYVGPMTLLQAAREMNEHDLSHIWQLRRLYDRLAAASV